MIVYKSNKVDFLKDVSERSIEDIVSEAVERSLHKKVGDSEYKSWQNSLPQVEILLHDADIPGDATIAIEYNIPRSQNRIDFIVAGQNECGQDSVVLIELKQWTKARLTSKDAIVNTRFAHGDKDTLHPSYQAWSYAMLLRGFNAAVFEGGIELHPCAYLHNYKDDGVITNKFYQAHMENAPLFCKSDKRNLREFIKKFVKYGDKNDVITVMDNGEIRPSKTLADNINDLMKGNEAFTLIDQQKVAYEEALHLVQKSKDDEKHVLLIEGGPGTGKSVIAMNLLAELTRLGKIAQYVTRNSAPREVLSAQLTQTMKKTHISNLFSGSGSYVDAKENTFDVLIVDEAHRLNEKSGLFSKGENQIKEIINASVCSVFFIDEDQRVTFSDIGSKDEIKSWARKTGATVHHMELTSQFRCAGSDGYIAWLDNALQIHDTANVLLSKNDYDFTVCDDPNQLREHIYNRNEENNKARIVAGYCWDWASKKDKSLMDVLIPEFDFEMKWNLNDDGMHWIIKPDSVTEVGCIHTCQGLEVDYIGVIIGEDLMVRDGVVVTDPDKRSRMDQSIKGYKKLLKSNAEAARAKANRIIKNTYRTLMSRGLKGCYIYCVDSETRRYFKDLLG